MRVRQSQLDFLRGLAALMVVANHTRGALFLGGEKVMAAHPGALDYLAIAALQVTSFGTDAVILFFVLSGFAMAHSVGRSTSAKHFYLRRVVRIWPPYLAACLFAALIGLWTDTPNGPLVQKMFYISPGAGALTPQFWSLPFEVVFYALCPLILSSRDRVHWLFAVSSAMFVGTAVFGGLAINPWHSFVVNFLGNELFLFAGGAMAYHHLDRIPKVSTRTLAMVALVTLAVAWTTKRAIGEVNVFSMVAIVGAAVLAIPNAPERKSLNAGFFSYSLYLFHYALIVAAAYLLSKVGVIALQITNPVAWMPIAVVIVVLSFGLYLVTERISNQWVVKLRGSSNSRETARPMAPR